MARTSGSDGIRTEETIRAAALALIARRGYEAMTMRELAEEVGVQPGSIYRYFPGKSKLLLRLMVEHLEFLLESWARERPPDDEPRHQLAAFVEFHIRCHTLRTQEAFVANMELRSLSPQDRARVVALRRRYEAVLADILRAGARQAMFRIPDVSVTTYAILAMLTGVGTWYRDSGRLSKKELVRLHTTLVMRAVGLDDAAGTVLPAREQRESRVMEMSS